MNDDETIFGTNLNSSAATIVIGLDLRDPVLRQLNLPLSNAISLRGAQLSADLLHRRPIACAICSLFAQAGDAESDAVSVIAALSDAKFSGEVIILTPPLLRPKMVENELRSLARGMRLRLLHGVLPPLDTI